MEQSGESEATSVTSVVAQRMRELRRLRDWSAERLAEEMTKRGISWNRGVVTKLETGRREAVSVAELIVLARVFDVSPLALLFPSEPSAYAIAPNEVAHRAELVWDWFTGRSSSPVSTVLRREWLPAGLPSYLLVREQSLRHNQQRAEQQVVSIVEQMADTLLAEAAKSDDSATRDRLLASAKRLKEQGLAMFDEGSDE